MGTLLLCWLVVMDHKQSRHEKFAAKITVRNICWALFMVQAHFAGNNFLSPHYNLIILMTWMKISEAQTGAAIPTGWRDKVWTHQSGHRVPMPNFYPRSCSRLISSFTNYSCTHLSNGMEGIQFFLCTGRMFFPPKENIIYFFLCWLWLETHLRGKPLL